MSDQIEVEALGIEVSEQPIALYKVLKIAELVNDGGQAKMLIEEGYVYVNGELETRKRRKLYDGDVVYFDEQYFLILCEAPITEPVRKEPKAKESKTKDSKNKTANTKSRNSNAQSQSKKKSHSAQQEQKSTQRSNRQSARQDKTGEHAPKVARRTKHNGDQSAADSRGRRAIEF
ncbi:hypothetical protein VST7929_01681 [Vibrio stylophorae]|uniref:RNA-binding S4 domain-containing protein n=1 Tax=Vibrio stylophorae TaxID=659351 RepID=A0ABM8ZU13_9VIBR|nr:RNA-binding S4 domain-containing protein [Vibrio stylophorae]CAH0533806.1 hypothetical protein VST7929_01681 [Vibrio stylophorae]